MRRLAFLIPLLGLGLTACRQDMHDQPKYKALAKSTFFTDGRAARPLEQGVVARGFLREDAELYTGKKGADFVKEFPVAVTAELLERGQNRYTIYCTPCHDRTGSGLGMVVRRGFRRPPSYHIDRLRQQPPGYFYDVITNGFGVMPDYAAQIQPRDRWAIVAYVKVLQRSQFADASDVPADELERLKEGRDAAGKPAEAAKPAEGHAK